MIPAERERDRSGLRDLLHRRLERRQGDLDVAGVHLDVTGVVDLEVAQPVGPQRQRGSRPVVRQVVGHPDGLRPEAGAGPVGGAAVERRTQDHHIGVGVAAVVVEVALGTPRKVKSGPNCGP